MVDTLENMRINLLFCIGGDGTLRGANAIAEEIVRRKLAISVIGVPKTIDNDLRFVEKTFGFETAVQTAFDIITSAHNEAEGADNGIGIVKLMGRDSGFIAASATLANSVVDFCLVPEIDFALEGSHGLFGALERKLAESHHAVIVVAEGAGQSLFAGAAAQKDASGNVLKHDIGVFLKDAIAKHFSKRGRDISIKYLDPSYHIRSVAAISSDAIFCYLLAENAVHAGMAGKTGMVIGHWNNFFTHVPIALATRERHKLDLDGALWKGVLSATRQNDFFG
jgi:6-phosphofructokinase 1